ncbi:oocyte zinc finger protein XlCOF6 isoform X2 [Nilaparvata lugens]|uniref:oocyte zinc finger protein XlCOF6 isoform X2 n=1 Tax=Nilaparvata lugens TaxID=108931 RepID=UPI000B980530|nr:oocyte zinc finger protein XlCOF6 isoform X2 [Nilaparvata lugens]
MIPYMNVDLRSINLHYDQRMNWMLNNHQRITEERQHEKPNPPQKEKPQININQPMPVNQLNSRSISLGVQTDSDSVQSYERSSKGQVPGVISSFGHQPSQGSMIPLAKEESAIRSLMASSNPVPTDYEKNFIVRVPTEEHAMPKSEPGTNGGPSGGPPYYGETDFDTNYYSKLDCNQLRPFKDQSGIAVFPNGNHFTDADGKARIANGFDVRNPAYSLYNDASNVFSQNAASSNDGSKPNEGHIVNRKPNAIVRLGGEEVTCEVCDKKFPHIWLLKIHSTKHTGRRLRTCQLCSKAFVSAFGTSAKRRQTTYEAQHGFTRPLNDNPSSLRPLNDSQVEYNRPVTDLYQFENKDVVPGRVNNNLGGVRYNPGQCESFRQDCNSNLNRSDVVSDTSSVSPAPSTSSSGIGGTAPCDLCNRVFTITEFDDDSTLPYGKMYACDVCNRSYSTLGNLKQHKEKHYGEKNFVCEKCNKCFFTAGNLKQHLITHTGEKSFLCKLCNKTYSTSGNLRQHLMTHTGQKTNFCVICNRSFSTLGNLKQHMLTHFATNLYPCEVCKKSYSTLGNLKQHMLTHTGQKIFPCDKCDKTFTTLGNAKQHMIRHSGEKPYVCQTCSKSFFTLGNLKQHALTHSEEKLYKCDKCTKSFYTLSNLKQHSATHSDVKKTYDCDICIRSFSTFGNLKQHKLKHSLNITQVPSINIQQA